jgi:N-acetylneuraminic acid mutarotase
MRLSAAMLLLSISSLLSAQSWVQKSDAPVGRHHPISFSLNGKGYAITGTLITGQPTDEVYEYDPVTDSWSTLGDFPGVARSFGIGTVSNGKAYLGFGATNTQYLKDFWRFDGTDSSWTRLADCGCSGRRHPAMIADGDKIYVGLGDDSQGDRNDWWMYSISNNTWTQLPNLPGPGRHHPFMFNAGGEVYAGLGHSGQVIYRDWYKLDSTTNTWTAMNLFPGEARVAGTQFSHNGFGFVLSGDGDNHSYMNAGEMWRYNPVNDTWTPMPSHPGRSRWAPGSFVINGEVYFFGGRNRFTTQYPNDLWKFDLGPVTVGLSENEQQFKPNFAYPNPASQQIMWDVNAQIQSIRIVNTTGQLVLETFVQQNSLDVSTLENGVYFATFIGADNSVKTTKLMIQH